MRFLFEASGMEQFDTVEKFIEPYEVRRVLTEIGHPVRLPIYYLH